MTDLKENHIADLGFQPAFKNNYAEVYTKQDQKVVACILKEVYVPIKEFRNLFNEISKIVKAGHYEKFIFDKRSLRTFHQPSMEWYFLKWKTEMLDYGLFRHRKILPDLEWFVKAVEVAKRPLLQKMSSELAERLDISYCDSVEEALTK